MTRDITYLYANSKKVRKLSNMLIVTNDPLSLKASDTIDSCMVRITKLESEVVDLRFTIMKLLDIYPDAMERLATKKKVS